MSQLSTSTGTLPVQPSLKQLLANRNYRLLLAAQFVSDLGDGVYALGLLWAVKVLTGSGVQMSFVLVAELVPTLVFGMFAGAYVDSGRKKRFMVVADVMRGLVVSGLAVLWGMHRLEPWMLIAAAAVLSTFSAFFAPAKSVAVRLLVPKEMMMRAQSLSQTVQTIVGLCAPALGAVLLSFNIVYAFAFNALSFFLSFLCLSLLRQDELDVKQGTLDFQGLRASLQEGWRVIFQVPVLRHLVLYTVVLNFMLAPISVLFPLYADSANQLATYETLLFIGLLAGSIMIGFMSRMRKIVPITVGLLLIMLGFGSLSILHSFTAAALCMFCAGLGMPLANVTLSSLFAMKVPREVLGRASSTMRVLSQGASPLSLSATASLLLLFSVRDLFLSISLFGVLIILLMVINPVLRSEE